MKKDVEAIKDVEEAKRLLIEFNEEIEKQDKEIERLNKILEDINYYIEQITKENITDEVRIELRNIELMSKGIVKVVREEK